MVHDGPIDVRLEICVHVAPGGAIEDFREIRRERIGRGTGDPTKFLRCKYAANDIARGVMCQAGNDAVCARWHRPAACVMTRRCCRLTVHCE